MFEENKKEVQIDEEAYLEANPDVKVAIESGHFRDVQHHLEVFGFNEIAQGLRKLYEEEDSVFKETNLSQIDIQTIEEPDDVPEEKKVQDKDRNYYKEVKKILNLERGFDIGIWRSWLKTVPQSTQPPQKDKAHVELAASTPRGKEGIIVGWIVHRKDSITWVEDEEGNTHFFDNAYRMFRQDVYDAFYEDMIDAIPQTGFILRVKDINPGQFLYIKSLSEDGIHTISSMEIKSF